MHENFQGTSNAGYHPVPPGPDAHGPSPLASVPGPKMPKVVAPTTAPTTTPMGFMPMTGTGVVQRSGVGSMQPASPTQAAPIQPAVPPAAAPPTIQTVDTSNVPGNLFLVSW